MIDFWDEKDSPRGSGPPWPDPADPLNEVVTFFVSDGLYVDSDQMIVQAVDDGVDFVSPVTEWTEEVKYDVEGDEQGWGFLSANANADDQRFTDATSSYNGSALGVVTQTGSEVTNTFGWWLGPEVSYQSGKLFKYAWEVSTSQADQDLVPTARMRILEASFKYAFEMTFESAGVTNPNAPESTPKVYNQYLVPPVAGNMAPNFDVYSFGAGDATQDQGTVWMEELIISSADIPMADWSDITVPAFSGWSVLSGPGPFEDVSTGTTGGLMLGTTASQDFNYGYWQSGDITSYTADSLYRAEFSLTSSDTLDRVLLRASSSDLQASYRLTIYGEIGPDSDGEDYALYFEPHDFISGNDQFGLFFEVSDNRSDVGGEVTLTDVLLQRHAGIE